MRKYKVVYQTGPISGHISFISSPYYYRVGQIIVIDRQRLRILECTWKVLK